MTAGILDGKKVQAELVAQLTAQVEGLKKQGINPGLGTILVGDDPASQYYIKSLKHSLGEKIGLTPVHRQLPGSATTAEVIAAVEVFNQDPQVSGFIVQLPLPKQVDTHAVLAAINPAKDADGLHPFNLGNIVLGQSGPLPCTPQGIIHLLEYYKVPLEGAQVSIVGRGITVGRPLSLMLSSKKYNATVTSVHSATKDVAANTKDADIIIAAAGQPGIIKADMIKTGATVVDVGVSRVDGAIVGDVAPEVWDKAAWVSPNPGGVGPLTVGFLMANTVTAAAAHYE